MSVQTIKTDPAHGITVVGKTAYFSLGSSMWTQMTGGPHAKDTWHYQPPSAPPPVGFEMATMNMAKWDENWYSAKMRLEQALGFGTYDLSIKVGIGSGVTTTFYLSEHDRDKYHEIDFEFSGHCNQPNTPAKPCGTSSVWTNVFHDGAQFPITAPLWSGAFDPPNPLPNSTAEWGLKAYRYRIDFEPDHVQWLMDPSGKDNFFGMRRHDISKFGYQEHLLYPFISFWQGWCPDNSPFLYGKDAYAPCGPNGSKGYQAFFFQALAFTPSKNNKITILGT